MPLCALGVALIIDATVVNVARPTFIRDTPCGGRRRARRLRLWDTDVYRPRRSMREQLVDDTALDVLMRAPFFAELDPADVALVAEAMQRHVFRAGETVILQGGEADGFFVVESGEAEVLVEDEPRGTIGPGDCFGEIALLTGSERAATVRATSDLHCLGIAPDDFRVIVEGNPAIAWELYQSMVRWTS